MNILFIYFYSCGSSFQGFRGYPMNKQPQRIMKFTSAFIIILHMYKQNKYIYVNLQKLIMNSQCLQILEFRKIGARCPKSGHNLLKLFATSNCNILSYQVILLHIITCYYCIYCCFTNTSGRQFPWISLQLYNNSKDM